MWTRGSKFVRSAKACALCWKNAKNFRIQTVTVVQIKFCHLYGVTNSENLKKAGKCGWGTAGGALFA